MSQAQEALEAWADAQRGGTAERSLKWVDCGGLTPRGVEPGRNGVGPLRACPKWVISCPKPAEHEMDHGHLDERRAARGRPLVVLAQPEEPVQPAERPLDDPPLGLRHEPDLADPLPDHHADPAPLDPGVGQRGVEVAVAPEDLDP